MSTNIQGKVVVITGASSGLGEAAARHLSAEGAAVVLGARRLENAGLMPHSPLERLKIDDWNRTIDVNIKACSTASRRRCPT